MARVEEWEQLLLNKQLKLFKQYVSLALEKKEKNAQIWLSHF